MTLALIGLVPPQARVSPHADHLRLEAGAFDALAIEVSDAEDEQDADRMLRYVRLQNSVLSRYIAVGDVLPVRFGAVFSGATALRKHVIAEGDVLRGRAEALAEHVEYLACLDPARSPPINARREERLDGTRYLQARKRTRDMRRRSEHERAVIHARVSDLLASAGQIASSALRVQREGGFRCPVLVHREETGTLLARLDGISEVIRESGFALRLIGPSAPFSFLEDLPVGTGGA